MFRGLCAHCVTVGGWHPPTPATSCGRLMRWSADPACGKRKDMQVRTLSDHAGDMARRARGEREAQHDRAMAEYRAALAARSRRVGELRAQTVAARRAGQWRAWLQHCRSRLKHALSAAPKKPRMPGRSEEEVRWSTGAAGEQRVEQILAAALDDGWILINGYRNRNGEVDQLLVSAHGLLAIEIKYMSGIIHCLDGAWTREKVGGRGGLQGQNWPIMDRGGRSPGDQVNSVAGRLQRFLRRRDMDVRIARAVVLAHPNARLGHMEQHGLDLIAT